MTLPGLTLRNAFLRNKTRSFLTILGVVLSAVAFLFLRTILTAWYASAEASSADRVVTRNAVSLINPLPLSYAARSGHVMLLMAHVGGDKWKVYDSNSGGGLTRVHVRSIRGFAVVNPHATNVAQL